MSVTKGRRLLLNNKIDVVAGQESWEKEDTTIHVEGYKWFGKPRIILRSQRGEAVSEGKYGGSKKDVFNFREKGEVVVVHGDFNGSIGKAVDDSDAISMFGETHVMLVEINNLMKWNNL